MLNNDSRAAFPNRIRALIVDNDARFLRSACLMLSLLNFRVATCDSPASAVKLLSGTLFKDGDVVFIDALRATTCGFDFRGIVERHLFTPVIYFFSFDYKVAGDVAEALRRTVWAATYVIKKPLDAGDLSRLWRIIQWSKVLLRRGENTLPWLEWPRDNQALPAAIQALLPSFSTSEGQGEEDDGSDLFKVVREGRGRRRKLSDSQDGGSSSGGGDGVAAGGWPTRRLALAEQMNVREGHESDEVDVVPSYQQPAHQNRRGLQATEVQNQRHGRSLFLQPPVPQMLNVPRNNLMISAQQPGPSSSNVAAFARASNTSAPALLPLLGYQAARATSPAPHALYSARAPAPGLPPPVFQQQQQPVAAARAGRGRRRKLGDSNDGGSSGHGRGGVAVGGRRQPTGRQEQMNVTEGQETDGDDVVRPSHQQPARQNRRGVQVTDVLNQQHRRSLFMQPQPAPQMLSVPLPHNNPMISGHAAGPSSSNAAAFAGASRYISAPALLPAYQSPARARATSPSPQGVYPLQAQAPGLPPLHQQQPVALYDLGNMVATPAAATTSGHQPPPQFTLNSLQQQDMFALRRQGGWMGRCRETAPTMLSFQQPPVTDPFTPMAGGGTTFGASPKGATDARAHGDAAVAQLQFPSVGAQPVDSFDDVLRAMMEMNDAFPRSDYANYCNTEALKAPAKDELAAMQAALGKGSCSNNNDTGSFMAMDVNGGNSASFMAPQDPGVSTGNQVEPGAPDIYGSPVESPGPSAMFNGNGEFPSDQYNENSMFSLGDLWNFDDDDVLMHPEVQQVAAADNTAAANATGIMPNGGESGDLGPNLDMEAADDGLDMVEEYLDHNASDFQLPQDNNNGQQ